MDTSLNTSRALNAENSPLLALPGELKNKIYRYVLLDNEVDLDLGTIHAMTGLLRTSSQTREEAEAFFYAENHFIITDPKRQLDHVIELVYSIGPKYTNQISHITLRLDIPDDLLRTCKILLANYQPGRTPRQALEALGKAMSGGEPMSVGEVLDKMTGNVLGVIHLIARVLVESGVQAKNISVQDLVAPSQVDPKNVFELIARGFVGGISSRFLRSVGAAEWRD